MGILEIMERVLPIWHTEDIGEIAALTGVIAEESAQRMRPRAGHGQAGGARKIRTEGPLGLIR